MAKHVVASMVAGRYVQPDGRAYLHTRHTDSDGDVHERHCLVDAGAGETEIVAAIAEGLDQQFAQDALNVEPPE